MVGGGRGRGDGGDATRKHFGVKMVSERAWGWGKVQNNLDSTET